MKELINRMLAYPVIGTEILCASLFINVLGVASSLYVIQVLNRYIAGGIDETLYTLTTGVGIAVIMELVFRQIRLKLAYGISFRSEARNAHEAFNTLTRADIQILKKVPAGQRREVLNGLTAIGQAYTPLNIANAVDAPFSLLYIAVLFLLSPPLAGIVVVFVAGAMVFAVVMRRHLESPIKKATLASADNHALISSVLQASDGVRAFNAAGFLGTLWWQKQRVVQSLSKYINARQGLNQSITHAITVSMSVVVIAVGATLAVSGEMDVGSLIGANILASRALLPIVRVSQLGSVFVKARQSLEMLRRFVELPHERAGGSTLHKYMGSLELRDLSFAHSGATAQLFERLSIILKPGKVFLVKGANGAGKTTLARLIVGLLVPTTGQIFMDGVDIRQLDPRWMRRQFIYLPQEPVFFSGTVRDNLSTLNPRIDTSEMERIIALAGLTRFLEESEEGLESRLENGGATLSPGIRRRLALARALSSDGPLAILDEPTEGLDRAGRDIMAATMNMLVKNGKTLVVFYHDDNLVEGADFVLDLDARQLSAKQQNRPNHPRQPHGG